MAGRRSASSPLSLELLQAIRPSRERGSFPAQALASASHAYCGITEEEFLHLHRALYVALRVVTSRETGLASRISARYRMLPTGRRSNGRR
jgi:hypothetical protein